MGALVVVGLIGRWLMQPGAPDPVDIAAGDGDEIVQVEATSIQAIVAAAAPFIDIPGDPMILRLDPSANRARQLIGPPTLDASRVGPVRAGRLTLIEDELIARQKRLQTVLPSTREDFAFFQARQGQLLEENAAQPQLQNAVAVDLDEGDGAFGELLQTDVAGNPDDFTRTEIQNTTSVAILRPSDQRVKLYDDIVVALPVGRSFRDVLTDNGFDAAEAERFERGASRYLPQLGQITAGSILAIRVRPEVAVPVPLQVSLYGSDGYIGSVARIGAGRYALSADPWIDVDLVALARGAEGLAQPDSRNFRLLDALYSAAIRNGVPTALVGELIVMMAQAYDLEGFARPDDRLKLLYAPSTGPGAQPGPGNILFAAIKGPSGNMACYVVPDEQPGAFRCFDPRGRATGQFAKGMVLPVKGWPMSSPFGPRRHPILKTVRNHSGVDWAAPIGTPVLAAADGKVTSAGVGGGYGNLVIIDHGDGVQTRYAHLNSFAVKAGAVVRAGDPVGEVGTTGLSTGPHLHFELHVNGAPVDPMAYGGSAGARLTASAAVEALTDQIIKVESAGVADARNSRSTATGLGQFIESTWLRMIRTYRPDLMASMSREDILALRTNPSLSREMVQNLARESEAYLRARGHAVTAGRLYLAHFLGAEGADVALKADPAKSVAEVMGASVVSANPFLRNFTIADLRAWADRKMGNNATPTAPVYVPPEVQAFRDVVDEILAAPG